MELKVITNLKVSSTDECDGVDVCRVNSNKSENQNKNKS